MNMPEDDGVDVYRKQKAYVELVKAKEPLPKMAGGKKTHSTWFKQVSRGWKCGIRYGQQPIPLNATGETMVVVGATIKATVPFLDGVIAAAGKGELDSQLMALHEVKSKALTAAHEEKRKAKEAAKAAALTQDVQTELERAA
jgi:hypothetical protein